MQDSSNDIDRSPRSEDCLTLNVWTPPPRDQPRPVMVWIHGGAFLNGSGDLYDARRLASRGDIVVVTINYRLGALGFLAHPALGAGGDVGNYGLADQQAALRWVHDNIAGFGGDPDKVTVAGESAGGMSVCDHLVAPDSAGLFRAAIMQSGPCQLQPDLPAAQKASADYAAEAGCADPATAAQCLRALPADKLQTALVYRQLGTEVLSGPVTGTTTLPVDPVTGIAEGRAARVPVMIGTTGDEFNLVRRAATDARAADGRRRLSGAAGRSVRSECGGGRGAVPAGAVRRQCAAGLCGGDDRRRLRVCGRSGCRRAHQRRARVRLRVQRSRCACARTVPGGADSRSAQAIHWSCGTCSTSAVRRRCTPAQRAPVGSDDRLLEPVRHDRIAERCRPARLARARRRRVRVRECRCSRTAIASSPTSRKNTDARSGPA